MTTPCLGIVGWSGSGKTTLLERLLLELRRSDHRVGVLKHSHHDVVLEPEHKDTARFRRAGATQVVLASPYRLAFVEELQQAPEPSLADILGRMQPADLYLIEGYKWAEIPKLEVWRPSLGKPALYPNDPWIRAVAADVPRSSIGEEERENLVWLDLNDIAGVLQFIKEFLNKK